MGSLDNLTRPHFVAIVGPFGLLGVLISRKGPLRRCPEVPWMLLVVMLPVAAAAVLARTLSAPVSTMIAAAATRTVIGALFVLLLLGLSGLSEDYRILLAAAKARRRAPEGHTAGD